MGTNPDIFCCESRVMNHFRFPSRTYRAAAIAIVVMISREKWMLLSWSQIHTLRSCPQLSSAAFYIGILIIRVCVLGHFSPGWGWEPTKALESLSWSWSPPISCPEPSTEGTSPLGRGLLAVEGGGEPGQADRSLPVCFEQHGSSPCPRLCRSQVSWGRVSGTFVSCSA